MIHYHGTPCGGDRQGAARFLAGRHCMVPYPRPEDLPVALEACASFCVDNGAYTVWKNGGKLDVEGYFDFVEKVRLAPNFDFAVIPDEVEGPPAANEALIARWPFPRHQGAPVWHLHEPIDRLRSLAAAFPRVCLGSSGEWSTPGTPSWWRRMTEALTALCDAEGRPPCKLHGLRMLSPHLFTRLPLSSADSTNAVRNGNLLSRFGTYPPMTLWQRQAAIADRVESYQSAPCWRPLPCGKEGTLFDDDNP